MFYTPSNACACAVSRARIRRLQPWARPAKTKARALTSIFLINYLPRSQTAGSWFGTFRPPLAGCHDFLAATATGTGLSVTVVLAQEVPVPEGQLHELLEYQL